MAKKTDADEKKNNEDMNRMWNSVDRVVERTTDRISRAVTQAMQALGLGALPEEIERVYKIASHFDKRQEQLIKAKLRSLSAEASTFKSNVEDD
jgi:hypothetical protein